MQSNILVNPSRCRSKAHNMQAVSVQVQSAAFSRRPRRDVDERNIEASASAYACGWELASASYSHSNS